MKTDKSYQNYMFGFIERICKDIGPRLATTEKEYQAIDEIEKELKDFSDETIRDEFYCTNKAYPGGLTHVAGFLCTLGFCFFATPLSIITTILCILGLLVLIMELMVLAEFIDFLYPKGKSFNIFGKIKPSISPKKLIIFGGHSDSAYNFPFTKYGTKMNTMMYLGIGLAVYAIFLSPIKFILQFIIQNFVYWDLKISGLPIFTITIIDIIFFIPFMVWFPFFLYIVIRFVGKTLVPGANDNLSGVAVALAIGKYLAAEHRPENVEVWVGSFGAEEVGQRGSKAFVKKYGKKGILDNSLSVILESVGGGEGIGILKTEKMYFTTHFKEVYEPVYEAFKKYESENKGVVPGQLHEAVFAGTDAVRFSKKGYPACAVVGGAIETLFLKNWHSPADIPENLNKKLMRDVLETCLYFVELIDKRVT
ncbi:MAG: M20/M25/M40 family metallo-hydrolase [Candidatus Helarchaeota archaeon]|nr:M20/M25/M40 family metallo-hydrolase [Candidatus Helarchaeota archaeon]